MNVFIVDDDRDMVDLYKAAINSGGYCIAEIAYDGNEAVDKYRRMQKKPDLILMDYNMPRMNGLEATVKILKQNPEAAVVILSADITVKSKLSNAGIADFILKPFSIDTLLSCLNKHKELLSEL